MRLAGEVSQSSRAQPSEPAERSRRREGWSVERLLSGYRHRVAASDGRTLIERLVSAINRHDLDGIVEICHPDFRGELPAHPARNYRGRDMWRANWALIFELVPNLVAELTRCSVDGELVWAEWSWSGTLTDGARFERTGVAIHALRDGRVQWVRTHMQPITSEPAGAVDAAMREMGRNLPGR